MAGERCQACGGWSWRGGGEGGLGVAFRPRLGGGCHSLKLFCTLAVVPAMTQQSLLQEVMVGTVMLAAFPPQGTEPHGMSVASEITLGYLPGHLPEDNSHKKTWGALQYQKQKWHWEGPSI